MGTRYKTTFGTAAAVALCCVAIGCGGGDGNDAGGGGGSGSNASGEKARVVAALAGIGDAMAQTHAKAACALLTKRARDDAAKTIPGATSCTSAMETIFGITKRADRQKFARVLKNAEKRVSISGDDATVSLPGNPGAKPLLLRREGGDWKLAKNPLYYNPK